jgi:hypothetical protein
MARHWTAFVDESILVHRERIGVFVFAAILVGQGHEQAAEQAARAAARGSLYHSADMYHRGHVGIIESMLDVVYEHADWTLLVVQTPLDRPLETVRQTALARLLRELNQQRVRDVILDRRGSEVEWDEAALNGRRRPEIDRNDLRTYRHLVQDKQVSPRLRLMHLDDTLRPGIWLADAVAWSARRALAVDEDQWWLRVAEVTRVLDAVTGAQLSLTRDGAAPPVGDHGPHHAGQGAHVMLSSTEVYQSTASTGGPRRAGVMLTSLLQQIHRATVEAAAAPAILSQLDTLSRQVADLAQQISELRQLRPGRQTVHRARPTSQSSIEADNSPSAGTGEPGPHLDR